MLERAFGRNLGNGSSSSSRRGPPLPQSHESVTTTRLATEDNGDEEEKPSTAAQTNEHQQEEEEIDQTIRKAEYAVQPEECVICIEQIQRSDAIFQCSTCYAHFHLGCIQSWVKNSLGPESALLGSILNLPNVWYCPSCRKQYNESEYPKQYKCYCGKEVDPPDDLWLEPHTCGEKCGKQLKCGHHCMQLCHAGPCPPCILTVDASCFCGKQRLKKRCGENIFSCDDICERELDCGHRCPKQCHPCECPPCEVLVSSSCRCGKHVKQVACKNLPWSCTEPCDGYLSCRNCPCDRGCHEGPCGPCPRSGRQTCPCGKTVFANVSCKEKLDTCGDTCDKRLPCGHTCSKKCHLGDCGPCVEVVDVKCRCGRLSAKRKCGGDQLLCNHRCSRMRSCGRHGCKRRCCDGNCPPCRETCARVLNCGSHKCDSYCHSGECPICPKTVDVTCACGTSRLKVRCGMQNTVDAPKCILRCRILADCNHAQREPHNCHYGPCPPCKQECGTIHKTCGHRCSLPCHYPSDCLPCSVEVLRWCVGAHERKSMKCSDPSLWSCGRLCNNLLQCGKHICERKCHAVLKQDKAEFNRDTYIRVDERRGVLKHCGKCKEVCKEKRNCPHPCSFGKCHSGKCPPCPEQINVTCFCGKSKVSRPCNQVYTAECPHQAHKILENLRFCGNKCHRPLPNCTHLCPLLCHEGDCPPCEKQTRVRCRCAKLSRLVDCSDAQSWRQAVGKRTDPQFVTLLECGEECTPTSKVQTMQESCRQPKEDQEMKQRKAKKQEFPTENEQKKTLLEERKSRQTKKAERTRLMWKLSISFFMLVILVIVYGPIIVGILASSR